MNNHLSRPRPALLGMALLLILSANSWAASLTAFTYQGRLNADGGVANGQYDFEFRLFAAETNGTALAGPSNASGVTVTNGAFLVVIDFGSGAFTGEARWLEIAVQCSACDGLPVTLSPRQALTPTPQALFALNAGGLMSYAGAPLDITLNGARVMRFQPATSPTLGFMPNLIGGGGGSTVTNGNYGVTISGGGGHSVESLSYFSTISGGFSNSFGIEARYSVIGGGERNTSEKVSHSTISGGLSNRIWGGFGGAIGGGVNNVGEGASYAVIGGGFSNRVGTGQESVIGGGRGNFMEPANTQCTIAGGFENIMSSLTRRSTIGGGGMNSVGMDAEDATISGGTRNSVGGYSRSGTVGGGSGNRVGGRTEHSTIAY